MDEARDYWLIAAGKDGEMWPSFFKENRVAIDPLWFKR